MVPENTPKGSSNPLQLLIHAGDGQELIEK
jgi:hypothetical protein